MSPEPFQPSEPVVWDEAREVVSIVLLLAAVMLVLAPMIRYLADGSSFGLADTLSTLFDNIGPVSGLLLVGSALLVVTAPVEDVVPALRRTIAIVSATIAFLGVLAVLVEVTSVTGGRAVGVLLKLSTISARSLPGTLLAGTATWLARHVVPFPKG